MNRADLQQLSRLRIREARVLLRSGEFHGAYYLAGYAVECAMKACIAKRFRRHEFPDRKIVNDSYTHDLERLLNVSGLKQALEAEAGANSPLSANWNVVKDWSEEARYDPEITPRDARDLYAACTARRNGILTWLRARW